jgi:hypothetical protein
VPYIEAAGTVGLTKAKLWVVLRYKRVYTNKDECSSGGDGQERKRARLAFQKMARWRKNAALYFCFLSSSSMTVA